MRRLNAIRYVASPSAVTEHLVLRSEDRTASLTIDFADAESYTGAVAADVAVSADGFTGAVRSVWFQRTALDAFDSALRRFERDRSGSVSVCNLGVPDATNEFRLTLDARAGGHAAATVSLLRVRHTRSGFSPLEVVVRFDVDGGDLDRLARAWDELFRERAEPPAT